MILIILLNKNIPLILFRLIIIIKILSVNYINKNIIICIKVNDKLIKIIGDNSNFYPYHTNLLKYFLFPKNVITALDNDFIEKLCDLDTKILLEIFTRKCLINPYYVLKNIY